MRSLTEDNIGTKRDLDVLRIYEGKARRDLLILERIRNEYSKAGIFLHLEATTANNF